MATWTTIPDSSLEPGKPIRSIDALALRDNPVAIAEGASGSPKVRTAALQPPSAASTNIVGRLLDVATYTTNTEYVAANLYDPNDSTRNISIRVIVGGSIRCYFEHRNAVNGLIAWARILKNGSQIYETSTSSSTYSTKTTDVTVATGDVITFQQRENSGSGLAYWQNVRIYSATPDMAVA